MMNNMKNYNRTGEIIYTVNHKSGLTVKVMPKSGYSKSYACFAARFGSVDNRFIGKDGEAVSVPDGIAHFLEHKLFEQKNGRNALDSFSEYGASGNAFTSYDTTAYLYFSTDKYYENLDLLLDFVMNPYFTPANVAKEQGIIGQEIKMYEDDPNWRLFTNALAAMYKRHPVRIDIAGTVESIAKIDAGILYKCYNTFYHPSNMVLFCIGAVDPDRVMESVDKFIDVSRNPVITRADEDEPFEVRTGYISENKSVSRDNFILGIKLKPSGHSLKQNLSMTILLEMLLGESTKSFKKLYDKRLIDKSFNASFMDGRGYAAVCMGCESDDVKSSRDALLEVLNGNLDTDSFSRVKKTVYGSNIRMLNSVDRFGQSYAVEFLRGSDILSAVDVLDEIDAGYIESLHKSIDWNNNVLSVISPKV